MFVGETNFLYSRHYIKTIFSTANEELEKLGGWFTANRLSLNIKKTKYTFFHKNAVKDNIPWYLKIIHILYPKILEHFLKTKSKITSVPVFMRLYY